MRGKGLVKLLKTVDLLSKPQGTTIDELSDKLEIDRRSVYRVLEVVEELGFPIYDDKIPMERKKRWKLVDTYVRKLPNINLPDINLSLSEIIALYLLKGEERLYKGTEIEQNINSAFSKIGMFVPDEVSDKLNKIKTLFIPSSKFAKDYSGKEEIIDLLTEAILQKKNCHVTYHSFYDDKIKDFGIDPLYFFENNGGLYLFVNSAKYGDIRTLAVERIKDLQLTGDTFEYPQDFDPEGLLDAAFNIIYDDPFKVKIWFSKDQARYIRERTWSKSQKITGQKDGSIILEMKTSGWWEVKKWVLSFGKEAKVLEPDKLKKEIIAELSEAKNNYD